MRKVLIARLNGTITEQPNLPNTNRTGVVFGSVRCGAELEQSEQGPVVFGSVLFVRLAISAYGNLAHRSSVMITTVGKTTPRQSRGVRPCLEEYVLPHTPAALVAPANSPPNVTPPPPSDINMQDVQDDQRSAAPGKKYRFGSEVGQIINASQIGEKIMDTPVQLSVREVLAVSSDVSGYLHDQTRKRRIPIATPPAVPTAINAANANVSSTTIDADVNIGYLKQLYACPSGQAKATIDNAIDANSLLDNVSELNMMPRRMFERTNLPIDTKISWRIDKYDSKTNAELDEHGPIGVCHKVSVDIGGVEVIQPIFVVEHCNNDLILDDPGSAW